MSKFFFIQPGPRAEMVARIQRFLFSLENDKVWKVDISEFKRTRSNDQNAYLWGVAYPAILKHLPGWDAEDIHEYCLGECFGWETMSGLGKKRIKPVRRSSKLSTKEFSAYVEFIQRTMAEKGIDVPSPNEHKQVAA